MIDTSQASNCCGFHGAPMDNCANMTDSKIRHLHPSLAKLLVALKKILAQPVRSSTTANLHSSVGGLAAHRISRMHLFLHFRNIMSYINEHRFVTVPRWFHEARTLRKHARICVLHNQTDDHESTICMADSTTRATSYLDHSGIAVHAPEMRQVRKHAGHFANPAAA